MENVIKVVDFFLALKLGVALKKSKWFWSSLKRKSSKGDC